MLQTFESYVYHAIYEKDHQAKGIIESSRRGLLSKMVIELRVCVTSPLPEKDRDLSRIINRFILDKLTFGLRRVEDGRVELWRALQDGEEFIRPRRDTPDYCEIGENHGFPMVDDCFKLWIDGLLCRW